MDILKAAYYYWIVAILLVAVIAFSGCSSTKHIPAGQHLLRKNSIKLRTVTVITNKGEIKDNIYRVLAQKPNTYHFFDRVPFKLWKYNFRYKKMHDKPDSLLPKTMERPVLIDTSILPKSISNIRSYLFNQGYFYARITDTIIYKRKKAYISYKINLGNSYLINKISSDVDDSGILRLMESQQDASVLKKNRVFSFSQVDEERNRLVALMRNNGYYKFSQENIRFEIDTVDKAFLKDVENPLESAINFISTFKPNKKPTLDIKVFVRTRDDTTGIPYHVGKVTVYPDYEGRADQYDTLQKHVVIDSILFKYHEDFVHARVMADRIYLTPNSFYSQDDQDRTVAKLNELGVFQYIRIQTQENKDDSVLDFNIFLNRTKKLDVSTQFELSNGSTYSLGNSLGVNFVNKNFAKGADLLKISVNGGIELGDSTGKQSLDHILLLTQYYGFNASLDFPKFIAPLPKSIFDNSNLPHTIVSVGENVIHRLQYFTLTNTSASFKYNWRQSQTRIWDFSPAFVNIISIRDVTASFQDKLNSSQLLSNSYKEIFIEGENLTFTYTNIEKKKGKNYFRCKLGFEEAGGLLTLLNGVSKNIIDYNKNRYAQYTKLDFDLQRFVNLSNSLFAFRFYGGIGTPYGNATALPYVKQYYIGGPYSLRGWRIRSFGPGRFYDSANIGKQNTIDPTGDIKAEFNIEYRFPIVPLFAGLIKMNGALFTDAGNIWLARNDTSRVGAEFAFNKLGQDIAMDFGAGARFDIASFLTFRIDLAIPIKKPYYPDNGGWVIDQIDFKSPTWRTNNLILNLSIGYPF